MTTGRRCSPPISVPCWLRMWTCSSPWRMSAYATCRRRPPSGDIWMTAKSTIIPPRSQHWRKCSTSPGSPTGVSEPYSSRSSGGGGIHPATGSEAPPSLLRVICCGSVSWTPLPIQRLTCGKALAYELAPRCRPFGAMRRRQPYLSPHFAAPARTRPPITATSYSVALIIHPPRGRESPIHGDRPAIITSRPHSTGHV